MGILVLAVCTQRKILNRFVAPSHTLGQRFDAQDFRLLLEVGNGRVVLAEEDMSTRRVADLLHALDDRPAALTGLEDEGHGVAQMEHFYHRFPSAFSGLRPARPRPVASASLPS